MTEAAKGTAPADAPTIDPPTFEDEITALIQQLTGCTPDADSIRHLQELVRDQASARGKNDPPVLSNNDPGGR